MAKKPAAKTPDTPPPREPRVVLLAGKEAFLRHIRTQELRAELAKAHGTIDTVLYDGASATAADVLDECRSFGLIASYKLVVLDNAEALIKEDARPLFERYCESVGEQPEVGATLLLRADTWRPGKLDALIERVGRIERCDEPTEDAAVKWVIGRAQKEHKAPIAPDAARALVDRVGPRLTRLDSELAKLAAASAGGTITTDLVAYFVGASREEAVWGIQETLLRADADEALRHVRYVLDVSRQPAQLVSYALVDLARKVHAVSRATRAGARPDDLKPLKLWGPSGDAIREAARRTDPDRALELFRAAVRGDARSKSGLGEPERTLEMVVLEFARTLGHGAGHGAGHAAR
jgi:DNA polymerase III delta subunit